MSVLDSLAEIREQALAELRSRKSLDELDQLRVSVFGKSGSLTSILRTMGKMDPQERAAVGKEANKVKQALESALNERREILQRAAQQAKFELERVDVTAPGRRTLPTGRIHPMTQTYREIRNALVGMGFSLFGGPEIELDENNFTLLNLPPDHPARDMQDTFYINENVVLRTHTSPCEIRALKSVKPPFRLIMPGRVFRVDEVDASHSPVFMQIEGFIVDKGLTLGDLKGTLDTFVRAVFGDEVKTRLRPSYFPFTEPSAEMDMSCTICGGKGCRVCKGTGWIEILGCGITNPHELENCGLDPKEWTALAFGVGVDRVASLKYGISDIRLEYENDARFLRQF
ncbi:MAG: phenylalanine--tRNA ligase subunit alpha [Clostridia bacterium]|nr:phenylalanine--tRNA ligase subunit alpha [Clostridia bacterium]MBQ5757601.1 phenylalanine--tRNA ligase subunit alpha [Clostridia bacterium]